MDVASITWPTGLWTPLKKHNNNNNTELNIILVNFLQQGEVQSYLGSLVRKVHK